MSGDSRFSREQPSASTPRDELGQAFLVRTTLRFSRSSRPSLPAKYLVGVQMLDGGFEPLARGRGSARIHEHVGSEMVAILRSESG